MKRLFIYYSLTGSGNTVADFLKDKDIEIRKVETKYKLSKHLLPAMMKGGFHAMIGKKAKLINYDSDVSSYDEIIIGSPIWNSRLTPPINSVLKNTDLTNKKLIFILPRAFISESPARKTRFMTTAPTSVNIFISGSSRKKCLP